MEAYSYIAAGSKPVRASSAAFDVLADNEVPLRIFLRTCHFDQAAVSRMVYFLDNIRI